MSDTVTEVTDGQSWFGRVMESIKGIAVGLVLFLAAFPCLFWNEGRAVKTAQSLAEGAAAAIHVEAGAIDPDHEGKLVHVNARATTDQTLSDDAFGVSAKAIKLSRDVEMYQWIEESETKKKKVGGKTKKVTTYTYEMGWASGRNDSSSFNTPKGHENPPLGYEGQDWSATVVKAGAFTLTDTFVSQLSNWEDYEVSSEAHAASPLAEATKLVDGEFYIGSDPAAPTLGDMRIGYQILPPSEVSILGQQTGEQLKKWTASNGYTIGRLDPGTKSKDEMFDAANSENNIMTWVLRLVGWGAMFIGLFLIVRPLVVVAEFIPVVGSLVGIGAGAFALFGSCACTFPTIGVAWLFYRPILGILLLSVGILAIVGMIALAVTVGRRYASGSGDAEEPAAEA